MRGRARGRDGGAGSCAPRAPPLDPTTLRAARNRRHPHPSPSPAPAKTRSARVGGPSPARPGGLGRRVGSAPISRSARCVAAERRGCATACAADATRRPKPPAHAWTSRGGPERFLVQLDHLPQARALAALGHPALGEALEVLVGLLQLEGVRDANALLDVLLLEPLAGENDEWLQHLGGVAAAEDEVLGLVQ